MSASDVSVMNGYEENVLGDYDVMVTAGEGMFWLSQILRDLAEAIGSRHPGSTPSVSSSTLVVFRSGKSPVSLRSADRKSTRLNSSHITRSRMPSSA